MPYRAETVTLKYKPKALVYNKRQGKRTISKPFRKYLSNTSGKHEIEELQKTAILGTAHILRKVPMLNYKRLNIGNSIICTMNSNYRIAATVYSQGTWFSLRNVSVHTLHKGDDDDDDDDNALTRHAAPCRTETSTLPVSCPVGI
jgi:hypothetical protein